MLLNRLVLLRRSAQVLLSVMTLSTVAAAQDRRSDAADRFLTRPYTLQDRALDDLAREAAEWGKTVEESIERRQWFESLLPVGGRGIVIATSGAGQDSTGIVVYGAI